MKRNVYLPQKVGLFVAISSWFIYTAYWFVRSLWNKIIIFSTSEIMLQTFLISEIWGFVGLILRTTASLMAFVAIMGLLRNKETSRLLKMISFTLLLEAGYFLTFIPAAMYPGTAGYFSREVNLWLLLESGIPCLFEAIIMPITLLKLRSKINTKAYDEATKWSCITGIAYLLTWWLSYSGQWFAVFIQPDFSTVPSDLAGIYARYTGRGLNYILDYPLNMLTFLFTFVGLLALTAFLTWSTLPTIRNPTKPVNLKHIGITLTILGSYFALMVLLHLFFRPATQGGLSIWNVFFMGHNIDLWCITLPLLGIPLMFGPTLRTYR